MVKLDSFLYVSINIIKAISNVHKVCIVLCQNPSQLHIGSADPIEYFIKADK